MLLALLCATLAMVSQALRFTAAAQLLLLLLEQQFLRRLPGMRCLGGFNLSHFNQVANPFAYHLPINLQAVRGAEAGVWGARAADGAHGGFRLEGNAAAAGAGGPPCSGARPRRQLGRRARLAPGAACLAPYWGAASCISSTAACVVFNRMCWGVMRPMSL